MSDLKFLVKGSISKCLAMAPVFLFGATRHFVLFSYEFKIGAEVAVHRLFAVVLNGLNGKNSSRSIVRDIFFDLLFCSRFQDQLYRVFFCQDCKLHKWTACAVRLPDLWINKFWPLRLFVILLVMYAMKVRWRNSLSALLLLKWIRKSYWNFSQFSECKRIFFYFYISPWELHNSSKSKSLT